jgi:hypothetical protein
VKLFLLGDDTRYRGASTGPHANRRVRLRVGSTRRFGRRTCSWVCDGKRLAGDEVRSELLITVGVPAVLFQAAVRDRRVLTWSLAARVQRARQRLPVTKSAGGKTTTGSGLPMVSPDVRTEAWIGDTIDRAGTRIAL